MDIKTKRHSSPGNNLLFATGKAASTPIPRFENSEADLKLRQKFQFFLLDMVRLASIANIALPMNIYDDRGNPISVQLFLKRSGPKYIFQFIQSNSENLPLLRIGFSLIIVCLTYLKRLQLEIKQDESSMDNKFLSQQVHGMTALQQKTAMNHFLEEKAWVSQAASKVTDSISVSGCMSMFVTTHDALAQELILHCVASLMMDSDDSIVQMLTPPSVFNKSNRALDDKEKQTLLNGAKRPHSRAATSESLLPSKSSVRLLGASSNNLSGYNAEAAKASFRGENSGSRNRNTSSFNESSGGLVGSSNNNAADGATGNLTASSSNDERRASASMANLAANNKSEDGMMNPSQFNSLSYMLSVTILQKNRHSLLSAAAEVIIVMAKTASQGLCESISRAETCPLPLLSAVANISNNGNHRNRTSNAAMKKFGIGSGDDETLLMPINPLTAGKVVEWAGIKIFLKFLHRYHSLMATKDVFIELLQQQHQLLMYENPHEDKNMLTAMAMNNLVGLRDSVSSNATNRLGSPMMAGVHSTSTPTIHIPGSADGELVTSSKMLSEELQREFLLVHDRVFVALCVLIKGAPSIAPFIINLPGAMDVMRLSGIIYQERKIGSTNNATSAAGAASSAVGSSSTEFAPSKLPGSNFGSEEAEDAAVNIAMNTLQLEKQRMSRRHRGGNPSASMSANSSILSLDHMIYSATGGMLPTSAGANGGYRLGLTINLNETGSLSAGSGPFSGNRRMHSTNRGSSAPSPLARGFGNAKNQGVNGRKRLNTASGGLKDSGGHMHGRKLQPLGPPVTLSPSKIESLSAPITLATADSHSKPANVRSFDAPPYAIQTETKGLYKQNQMNRQQVAAEQASDLQYLAVNRMVHTAKAPLQAPRSIDSVLDTSLQVIDREAKESLIHGQPQKDRLLQPASSVSAAVGRHPLLTDSVMNFDPSQSSTLPAQSLSSINHHSNSSVLASSSSQKSPPAGPASPTTMMMLLPKQSATSPQRMAATKDFFGALPNKPIIPKRIEAQDAIMPGESMEIIRRKFQQIASGALNQIKSTGSVYNNGKNALSLHERARRVYSPKQGKRLTSSTSEQRLDSSGLQPLNFLDDDDDDDDDNGKDDGEESSKARSRRNRQLRRSTDSPTANSMSDGKTEDDPEKTPAWNPRPEGLAYYGIRLDNVEFEEQDLFDNFKPIFGYEEQKPNTTQEKKRPFSAELSSEHPQSAFTATRGKIAGELEQTGDLLL